MNQTQCASSCASCGISRRDFLATGGLSAVLLALSEPAFAELPAGKKVTVRVLFTLHAAIQPIPDWPNIGFDFDPLMKEIMETLKAAAPEVNFVSSMTSGDFVTQEILKTDGDDVQGYIVYQLNNWNPTIEQVVASGKPALYTTYPYCGDGGFLVFTAKILRAKSENFTFISSTKLDDIAAAASCFSLIANGKSTQKFVSAVTQVRRERTKSYNTELQIIEDKVDCLSSKELLERLANTRLIAVNEPMDGKTATRKDAFGIEIIHVGFEQLNAAMKEAMVENAEAWRIARGWRDKAKLIAPEISDQTLFESAAMYLAQKALLKKYDATGITINCLGGFFGKHITAYPCLGFYELNNQALVGGCECDIRSAVSTLVMSLLTKGRSGFISDPVLDVATRQIIYAHCVAGSRVFGPQGPDCEIEILTHSEDRRGASVRAIAPTGYTTTSVEFDFGSQTILWHQAVAVDNSRIDRACRTKICAEVPGDFEKLYTEWDHWGWHRVTVYGDLKQQLFDLAKESGWKLLEEA